MLSKTCKNICDNENTNGGKQSLIFSFNVSYIETRKLFKTRVEVSYFCLFIEQF